MRGPGYRILGVTEYFLYAITFLAFAIPVGLILWYRNLLDLSSIISIFLADIPVGLVLYLILNRGESKERKLLDAIEVVESPKTYTHLTIHFSDQFNSAAYPYKHYYVVNEKSKTAYWVNRSLHRLIEARIIKTYPKHRDLDELMRYFDQNHIHQAGDYPDGDDLFRDKPKSD